MKHPKSRAERIEANRRNLGDDYAKKWRSWGNRYTRKMWGWVHDRIRRDYIAGLRRSK